MGHRVGVLDLALLNQLRNCYGSKHLVHGTQAKPGIEIVGDFLVAVRESPSLLEDWLAIFGHQHDAREPVVPGKIVEQFLEVAGKRGRVFAFGTCLGRRRCLHDIAGNNDIRLGRIHPQHDLGPAEAAAFLQHGAQFGVRRLHDFVDVKAAADNVPKAHFILCHLLGRPSVPHRIGGMLGQELRVAIRVPGVE